MWLYDAKKKNKEKVALWDFRRKLKYSEWYQISGLPDFGLVVGKGRITPPPHTRLDAKSLYNTNPSEYT